MTVDQVRSTHSWLQPKAPSSYPGAGLLNRGAFPNLRAPERFSFPPAVNRGSQAIPDVFCVTEGLLCFAITSTNRLQSIDRDSYFDCRALVCTRRPVSLL